LKAVNHLKNTSKAYEYINKLGEVSVKSSSKTESSSNAVTEQKTDLESFLIKGLDQLTLEDKSTLNENDNLDSFLDYASKTKELVDKIVTILGIEKNIVAEFNSEQFILHNGRIMHPIIDGYESPILVDDSVLCDDGTAFVHNTPGAGPIDYEVGIKNNLEIYSPISSSGHYTADILPAELNGMSVEHGQGWVITKLLEKNKLLFKTSIKHSYPHCWRCKTELLFRLVDEWFIDMRWRDAVVLGVVDSVLHYCFSIGVALAPRSTMSKR